MVDTAGRVVTPSPNRGYTAIAVGQHHSLAIRGHVGDINGDMHVNVGDLQQLMVSWGLVRTNPGYDKYAHFNGDGYTNVGDLQLLVQNWGK